MIIQRRRLACLEINQRVPRMRNVDISPLLLLIHQHLINLPSGSNPKLYPSLQENLFPMRYA